MDENAPHPLHGLAATPDAAVARVAAYAATPGAEPAVLAGMCNLLDAGGWALLRDEYSELVPRALRGPAGDDWWVIWWDADGRRVCAVRDGQGGWTATADA